MNSLTLSLVVITSLCSSLWEWRIDAASHTNNFLVWNVSVSSQVGLNQFIENVTTYSNKRNITNLVYLSLARGNYELDIVKLMNISINGSLIMESEDGSVEIKCTAYLSDLEELRQRLNPLSHASLVLLDGLVFTGCPVPILIEDTSNVVIQNCVFQ